MNGFIKRTMALLCAGSPVLAQTAAQAGFQVTLYDLKQEFVDNGIKRITQNLNKGIERGQLTDTDKEFTLNRITATTGLQAAASQADLAIEAVLEQMDLKRQIFGNLDRSCWFSRVQYKHSISITADHHYDMSTIDLSIGHEK